ncbi:MAG: sulfatase-like hydrolase/transferase, partial [Hungatella sp.]
AQGKFTRAFSYSTPTTGCYEEGLDYFYDGYYTDKAIEAIRRRDPQKPFLLNAMYLAPHPPFDIPEPWYSKIEEVTLPGNVGVWYENQSPLQMYNLTGVIGSRYTRKEWEETWKVYLGLVNLLDECVGKIIEELKEQEIYDNSLIIFTSDHGEMLGSHQLFQKMCMYEESVKTPLFIKFPKGFEYGKQKIDNLVSGIDVFPTLCDYLNLKPSHKMDGQSLMPLILGKETETKRKEVYIQFDGNGARSNFQRCILKDGYKLIIDLFKDEQYLELYCVETDFMEQDNLIFKEAYDQRAREMLDLLFRHMKNTGDMQTPRDIEIKEFRDHYLKACGKL